MDVLKKNLHRLTELSRRQKQVLVFIFDIGCSLFATWLAYTLRLESFHVPRPLDLAVYGLAVALYIPIFLAHGLYFSMIRYSGLRTIMSAAGATFLYGLIFFILLLVLQLPSVPRSVGILQPILFFGLMSNGRLVISQVLHSSSFDRKVRHKVIIYGAGSAGAQLAEVVFRSSEYRLVAFVDDKPDRIGRIINGKKVYSSSQLKPLVADNNVREVMLAIPNADQNLRRSIIADLSEFRIRVRSVPSLAELTRGSADISQLRELDVNDLIGRPPVVAIGVSDSLRDKTVLVTGAGGSIGSELCRQILGFKPSHLIMLDHSEHSLYHIERELTEMNQKQSLKVHLYAYLGDIRDMGRLNHIFDRHIPDFVYHAAAYKHVPLVEANPLEAITTNVIGTRNVAEAAIRVESKRFVMISTDKAVRPTNVMGASKRLAEQVVQNSAQGFAQRHKTMFSMVRFGNVLDSSGSVVPLFRQQINRGGPLTVTHPEVTRYFMTIPEAVSLVLQAGELAKGGEVFLLDMGQPIKILDLAQKMIHLSGLSVKGPDNPNGDIEIVTIGLRPGEKLIEELLIDADAEKTDHPQIMKAHEAFLSSDKLQKHLEQMNKAIAGNDVETALQILRLTVDGFNPSATAHVA